MRLHALGIAVLAGSLLAQTEPEPFGHSRHGSEFDEGPRQAAYLMPGLSNQILFPVAGISAEAQLFFNQAVTQQHGFWHYEAERSFRQVAKLHPECAMAYWGMTVANIDHSDRATGFITNAVERSASVPRQEELWINAWATYYGIDDKTRKELQSGDKERVAKAKEALADAKKDAKDKRQRRLIKDLGTLVFEFPDNIEAKAFLAIQNWHAYAWGGGVKIVSHTAIDALLDAVFAKAPLHLAHHYRIHLWDREAAKRSLKSAAVIGSTAPTIAHQWHMAGHIYAKLNRHAEAAWQQEAASRADHANMMRDRVMPFEIHNYGHNQEWLCRSLSHVGRWREALDLAKNMAELPRHPTKNRLSRGGDIAGHAQKRILSVCNDHELWQEAVELCRSGFLESNDDIAGEVVRLRLLGRALFRLDRLDEAERIVTEADALLVRAKAERSTAVDEAEAEAISKKKAQSDIDKAIEKAQRSTTRVVRSARSLQHALRAERLLASGDAKGALAEFKEAKGIPVTLRADAHVAAGEHQKAIDLLKGDVKRNPGRIPTARRLLAAYRAASGASAASEASEASAASEASGSKSDEARRIDELEAQLAAIPTSQEQFGADFGPRPPMDSLGPFRWQPTPAPRLELAVAGGAGKRFRLADFESGGGQPTLVVFYLGFGCLQCVEQLQAIGPVAKAFGDAGIRIVAVGSDTAAKAAKSIAALPEGERFPFPLLADPSLATFKAWRCYDDFEAMPLHGAFLVDGDGRVRWSDVSYEPFTEIDWLLQECQRLLQLPVAAGGK